MMTFTSDEDLQYIMIIKCLKTINLNSNHTNIYPLKTGLSICNDILFMYVCPSESFLS